MTSLSGVTPLASYSARRSAVVLERAVLLDRLGPRDARGAGDVPGPLGGLAHARRGDDLAVELGRRAHVDEDQLGVAEARQDVVAEGPQRVVGLGQLVAGRVVRRHVGRQRQAVVQPVLATAVEDAHVVVAVQLELPVRPRGEPVVVVAVQDDRRVGADAARRQQLGEVLARGDVAADAVGQLAGPVPADRRRAGGSARRRPCRRRPRRSGRSGRRGGPGPRSASTRAVSWLMVDGLPSWWAVIAGDAGTGRGRWEGGGRSESVSRRTVGRVG